MSLILWQIEKLDQHNTSNLCKNSNYENQVPKVLFYLSKTLHMFELKDRKSILGNIWSMIIDTRIIQYKNLNNQCILKQQKTIPQDKTHKILNPSSCKTRSLCILKNHHMTCMKDGIFEIKLKLAREEYIWIFNK